MFLCRPLFLSFNSSDLQIAFLSLLFLRPTAGGPGAGEFKKDQKLSANGRLFTQFGRASARPNWSAAERRTARSKDESAHRPPGGAFREQAC